MRKKDLLKFLRIIFYFLAIISLALSIMGRMARAESVDYSTEFWALVEDEFDSFYTGSSYTYTGLYNAFISSQNSYGLPTTISKYIKFDCGDTHIYYFTSSENAHIHGQNSSTSINVSAYTDSIGYNSNMVPTSSVYTSTVNKLYLLTIMNDTLKLWRLNTNGYASINPSYLYNSEFGLLPLYVGSSIGPGQVYGGNKYSAGNANYVWTIDFTDTSKYVSRGEFMFVFDNYRAVALPENQPEPFVEDSRLKLDTIISSGRKELVVDMSSFIDDLYASSYNISDFVLTLDYDGIEQTFDDLGEYINIYGTSSGWDCLAIIPYSEFGFDDNNNISDISVSVTKVSFSTNALYPNRPTVMESYQIATSYYLKNDLDNNIDWDDTNVIENPNETIQYDGDDFNDLKTSLENPEMQDHGTIYNDWHYVSSLPVWEGWESIYNVDIFTFSDSLNVEHTWYHVRADFDTSLVQQFGIYYYVPFKISNWLYDNAISNYYDVLVFKNYHGKYEDVDITAPDDYLIFYSNRYYLKKHILELGNVHKTVSSIGNQIYTLYDFTYKRMNDINGNIQKGFENVLSKDNAIIGLLSSVNFNLDKFGNMINSNLVSVVSGINGLKGSDDRDLTDIYDRLGNMITSVDLTGILTNLFVPTYTGFQDSFDDAIDSMGILALPFDVSKRFITASSVPYSSTLNVTFPEYEFNNLRYWDEYEFEFNPNSILSADWLEFLQYCNALFVIVTVTLLTYKHIFASPVSEESGIL